MIAVIRESAERLPDIWQLPPILNISRIELYVVPAAEPAGSKRACLRIATDAGFGWSEAALAERDLPRDWGMWAASLPRYIGLVDLQLATNEKEPASKSGADRERLQLATNEKESASKGRGDRERLQRRLIEDAIGQVCLGRSGAGSFRPTEAEQSALLRQADFYTSLF
ncbi:hypothetical protein [Paenibacillus sp. NPDC058071]|uniref:hypothetical protein n=1 Tax=Paenibacillus sp. NPDC058071 TaxID=3346326 RepID=UPI0036DCEC4F